MVVELDALATTSLALGTSIIYLLLRRPRHPPNAIPPPLRRPLTALVLAHTLYMLYCLIFARPPNIFTHFGIPIFLPADRIRALLIKRAGGDGVVLSKAVEGLITRLASFDMRTVYIRFGQALIQDCEYCRTLDQFALHALPRPLLQYTREAAVIGLVTARGSHLTRWRSWGIWCLIGAAAFEAYWVATVNIKITQRGEGVIYWHDLCWTLRHLLFLVLPAVLHLAPARLPASPAAAARTLPTTAQQLERALRRAHALRLTRAGIMREPSLRGSASEWWSRGRRAGIQVRGDVGVRRVAEKVGLGFVEGEAELRSQARKMTGEILGGIASSTAQEGTPRAQSPAL